MTINSRENFNLAVSNSAKSRRDFEAYLHVRDSALLHVAEGVREGLTIEQLMPRCQHLTNVIPNGVAGCYQRDLHDAYLNDRLTLPATRFIPHEDDRTNPDEIVIGLGPARIFDWAEKARRVIGASMSFGKEREISNWLVANRNLRTVREFDTMLLAFKDSLTGATLTWTTGRAMIHSANETPRMMTTTTEPYKTDFDETLNIDAVIVSDSNPAQVLFSLETTASFRIKRAFMKATTAGPNPAAKEGGDIKDNFGGEGSQYTLNYGQWVAAQNAILVQESGETGRRTFGGLCIEFEANPAG